MWMIIDQAELHPRRERFSPPEKWIVASSRASCSLAAAAPWFALPLHQTEVGQEEAVCHTQSAFAQIDPESGGETRSWISPQKRRGGFFEKAGRGGDQILANKESVKELILKKS